MMGNGRACFLFLLLLQQQDVHGCKPDCRPHRFKCPMGTREYDIETKEDDGNCVVVRDDDAKKSIVNNCWPSQNPWYNLDCMKGLDCSGPQLTQPAINYHFMASCFSHDLCYRYPGISQHHCDNVFHDNMIYSCEVAEYPDKAECYILAQAAYVAVWFNNANNVGPSDGCWKPWTRNMINPDAVQRIANKTNGEEQFDVVQSYKKIQSRCWYNFGTNTKKLWNATKPLINDCKSKRNKKISVKCWRKIGKNLKVDLAKEKALLIDCTDVQSNTMEQINTDEKTMTELLDLQEEAAENIEDTWEQNEGKWRKCWRASMMIAKTQGIKQAEKKLHNCWKINIANKIKEELNIIDN